jgi:N-formylglutamate amidohydrolase
VTTKTSHIRAGLGTIPRVVAIGDNIYRERLTFKEAKERIEDNYIPYHNALSGLLNQTREKFGNALLIDCHSMPSANEGPQNLFSAPLADIILGDCHGKSCDPLITDAAEQICLDIGLSVARNKPYAGGYTTRHYGQPKYNFHSLQIEIKRSLYMDELRIERGAGLAQLIRQMRRLINTMTSIDFSPLIAPTLIAAE